MKQSGVYAIQNKVNGRFYIGSSVRDISLRWSSHKSELRLGKHVNHLLQEDWFAYGESAFKFVILEVLPVEKVLGREQELISELFDHGVTCYNLSAFALPGRTRNPNRTAERVIIGADFKYYQDLYNRTIAGAKVLGITVSEFLRQALEEKVERLERVPEIRKKMKDASKTV